jgi:acetate kinase
MKILIANPGSTSFKCKIYDRETWDVDFYMTIERIGDRKGLYHYQFADQNKVSSEKKITDHFEAVKFSLEIIEKEIPVQEIAAVGFKVVLAKKITGCVKLDDHVIQAMRDFESLAPVHTRIYLDAVGIFKRVLPHTPLIGLFETAFHQNIPPEAYLYGIPYEYFMKYGIRKYGFHGASHHYIASRIKEHYSTDKPEYKIISCHLGGSSSVCAMKNGISVDTSMGMSPQCGLLNAKRVGDLDPFALLYLMDREKLSTEEMRNILINRSGVLGISGISGDFRDIEKEMKMGNQRAEYACKAFAYSVKRYIGEYLAILNGSDYVVFTGGLGQHSPVMREMILSNMEHLGIILDRERNQTNPEEGIISSTDSRVCLLVMSTDEEKIVAQEVEKLIH